MTEAIAMQWLIGKTL